MPYCKGNLLNSPLGLMERELTTLLIPEGQLFFGSIVKQTDEARYGMPTVDLTETIDFRTALTSFSLVLHASGSSTQAKLGS